MEVFAIQLIRLVDGWLENDGQRDIPSEADRDWISRIARNAFADIHFPNQVGYALQRFETELGQNEHITEQSKRVAQHQVRVLSGQLSDQSESYVHLIARKVAFLFQNLFICLSKNIGLFFTQVAALFVAPSRNDHRRNDHPPRTQGIHQFVHAADRQTEALAAQRNINAMSAHVLASLQAQARRFGFIHFYKKEETPTNECFGNFFETPIQYQNITYRCAEAAFQAQKFPLQYHQMFANCDGDQAFQLARRLEGEGVRLPADWRAGGNVRAMEGVLEAKFQQHPFLAHCLLATENAYLVEHCPRQRDRFWADGTDGSGENKLGQLLMQLRQRLGGAGIVPNPLRPYQLQNELGW